MCLSPPKPPKVKPPIPLPVIKPPPPKPKEAPKPKLIKEEGEKAKVEYGAKPKDALLANKRTNKSIVPLNRASLNTPGANQSGLGGTTA